MVKYCSGNFCKKNKRKYKYVYNRYPGAPRTKVSDPNLIVRKNTPTLRNPIPWYLAGSDAANKFLSWEHKILGYIPGFTDTMNSIKDFKANQPWKGALGLGSAALSIGSMMFPELAPGRLFKSAAMTTNIGRALYNTKDLITNAARQEMIRQGTTLGRGVYKGLGQFVRGARQFDYSTLSPRLSNFYQHMTHKPPSDYLVNPTGTPKKTTSDQSFLSAVKKHLLPPSHSPGGREYMNPWNPKEGRSHQRLPHDYDADTRWVTTKSPIAPILKSVFQSPENFKASHTFDKQLDTWVLKKPPKSAHYSSHKTPGVSHAQKFVDSPSYQKYQKQISKEWYNKPHIPPLKTLPFDVNANPGLTKPRLDKPTFDQFGNSLSKGKNPIN